MTEQERVQLLKDIDAAERQREDVFARRNRWTTEDMVFFAICCRDLAELRYKLWRWNPDFPYAD